MEGATTFASNLDSRLQDYLSECSVAWVGLDDSSRVEAEVRWRLLYGNAFKGKPRLRQGAKAEFEYRREKCSHYLIVPFSANVEGLPINVLGRNIGAYECRGPLAPLGAFADAEFFVSPIDLAWTMIHTHEDQGLGGPFFMRSEWL